MDANLTLSIPTDLSVDKNLYLLEKAVVAAAPYALNFLLAIVIFVVGRMAAGMAVSMARKVMRAEKVDETLVSFGGNLLYGGLLLFVVLAALGQLGIQTTNFLAVLGAAGLAIGLALQGSLSNFAAGVMIVVFRPFGVGDRITGAGNEGVVEEIQLFTTYLRTEDGKRIVIPNSVLTAGVIVNHTPPKR